MTVHRWAYDWGPDIGAVHLLPYHRARRLCFEQRRQTWL